MVRPRDLISMINSLDRLVIDTNINRYLLTMERRAGEGPGTSGMPVQSLKLYSQLTITRNFKGNKRPR